MAYRGRDTEADGWESSEFPIVCEDCLGPNPYVRMQKEPFGMECHISGRPFTVFRWRPGNDARYKKTVICREVALAKNVCQCCILDLETGLPVQVRDTAMGATGEDLPRSDVNKEYAVQNIAQQIENGTFKAEGEYGKASQNDILRKLSRTKPYYKRNRAQICTFWLRNACSRTDCPYRPCNGDTDLPELNSDASLRQQNIKDRYYGINDPVAEKMLKRAADMPKLAPPEDTRRGQFADADADKGRSAMTPASRLICTLFVGGLDERVDEESLKDQFYGFGELQTIRIVPGKSCAFVTYTTREAAEKAAEALSGGLVVKGLRLKLMWGKPAAQRDGGGAPGGAGAPPPGFLPPHMRGAGGPPGMPMPVPMYPGMAAPFMGGMPPPAFMPGVAAAGGPPTRAYYPSMDPTAMGTVRGPPGGDEAGKAGGEKR